MWSLKFALFWAERLFLLLFLLCLFMKKHIQAACCAFSAEKNSSREVSSWLQGMLCIAIADSSFQGNKELYVV
jgi:cytochrome c oxidase assembly factor CtaG